MGSYYYILASLPTLSREEPPPFDHETFLELCRPWLGRDALERLQRASIEVTGPPDDLPLTPVTRRWVSFENALRNTLARIRSKTKGVSEADHLKPEPPPFVNAQTIVEEALKGTDPLEAELRLIEARWRFLTEVEVGHHFDLEALVVYSLKRQLLERRRRFDRESGRRSLDGLLNGLLEGIPLDGPGMGAP